MGGRLQDLTLQGDRVTYDDLRGLPSGLTSLRMTLSETTGAWDEDAVALLNRLTALQQLHITNANTPGSRRWQRARRC